MFSIENVAITISVLLFLCILANKISVFAGIPSLLLFMVVGMLAGSEGPGGIYFDNYHLSQSLGVVALSYILFSGGMDTRVHEIKPVIGKGLLLSIFGVLLTAVLVGIFIHKVFNIPVLHSFLLGSIVSSTDAAAVFSILRSKSVKLKGNIHALIEFESGSNDPMAVFLTVGLISLIKNPDNALIDLLPAFFLQMILGTLFGYGFGKALVYLVNRFKLEQEGLYSVLTISFVLFTYSACSLSGGNGFLAVYIAGLVIGGTNFIHKRSIIRFHDGLAWLMQISMFLALGLLVFPSHLWQVAGIGLAFSLFLIFIARPVAVFLTLIFTKLKTKEKIIVSWVGLRGAVPIILATFPAIESVDNYELIFNIVFFVVISSVLIQGIFTPKLIEYLRLGESITEKTVSSFEIDFNQENIGEITEIIIPPKSGVIGKKIVNLNIPKGILIALISRNDKYIIPDGNLEIMEGDIILLISEKTMVGKIKDLLQA